MASRPDAVPPSDSREAGDTVARFADDLRSLRRDAGGPSLAELSETTSISKSVLSDAFAGRRLPTEHTVRRVVPALDGDAAAWIQRRLALDPKHLDDHPQPAEKGRGDDDKGHRPREVTRTTLFIAVGASAVLSSVLTLGGGWLLAGPLGLVPPNAAASAPSPSASSTYVAVENGADPMQSECKNDAVLAGGDKFLDGQVLVEMMYSNSCMAVWGRVTRYDGLASGNTVTMSIYPKGDPESDRTQVRSEADVQSLYTKMFIEPNVDARVCGVATVTVGGESFTQPNPVCI